MSARRGLPAATRVAAAVLAVLTTGVVLVSAIAYAMVRNATEAQLEANLLREVQAYGAALTPSAAEDVRTLTDVSRTYLTGRTATTGGVQPILLVKLPSGKVLSNSDVLLERAAGNASLLDPSKASAGFADLTYDGIAYRVATSPIVDAQGVTKAVFQAALPTTGATTMNRELESALLIACVAVIALGTLLSLRIAHGALRPLHDMAEAAERVTHESLAERIAYEGPGDELGRLANALDSMLDRLEDSFAEQKRFVADASHELRTPVAIIRGNLDILRQPWADENERTESLRVIDDEVARMQRLLEDMLSLARTDAGQRRPFQELEVSTLVTEVMIKARALADRRISSACAPDIWILGDPDLLEQALLNVVRNAVEHTSEQGSIALDCTAEEGFATLRISDDGPGLGPEDAERVFDRFYRGSGPRPTTTGGSGLGLSITRRLIEQHGGRIEVEQNAPHGATFIIRLPLIAAPV